MYRIVHNEQTRTYRVEKHGFLGWSFVTDPESRDYLDFDSLEAARNWVQQRRPIRTSDTRRWKVVSDCSV
jgi:hypothetical protein